MSEKYEVVHHHVLGGQYWMAAVVAILTGYEVEEVHDLLPARLRSSHGFYGRDFVEVFRSMGYNCSPNFHAKFDAGTAYPCLLRYKPTLRTMVAQGIKKPWWSVVPYYDGLVYDPFQPCPYALGLMTATRPTTMMQVWMGEATASQPLS